MASEASSSEPPLPLPLHPAAEIVCIALKKIVRIVGGAGRKHALLVDSCKAFLEDVQNIIPSGSSSNSPLPSKAYDAHFSAAAAVNAADIGGGINKVHAEEVSPASSMQPIDIHMGGATKEAAPADEGPRVLPVGQASSCLSETTACKVAGESGEETESPIRIDAALASSFGGPHFMTSIWCP